jgi:hypothetical protein
VSLGSYGFATRNVDDLRTITISDYIRWITVDADGAGAEATDEAYGVATDVAGNREESAGDAAAPADFPDPGESPFRAELAGVWDVDLTQNRASICSGTACGTPSSVTFSGSIVVEEGAFDGDFEEDFDISEIVDRFQIFGNWAGLTIDGDAAWVPVGTLAVTGATYDEDDNEWTITFGNTTYVAPAGIDPDDYEAVLGAITEDGDMFIIGSWEIEITN